MSIKKDIQNKFHDFVHALTDGISHFFEALSTSIEANGAQVLRDAAMAAVTSLENGTAGFSGEDKAKAAFASVVEVLEKQGLPIVTNAIKGAIEAAVAQVKA